jgi:hypothetical protein
MVTIGKAGERKSTVYAGDSRHIIDNASGAFDL